MIHRAHNLAYAHIRTNTHKPGHSEPCSSITLEKTRTLFNNIVWQRYPLYSFALPHESNQYSHTAPCMRSCSSFCCTAKWKKKLHRTLPGQKRQRIIMSEREPMSFLVYTHDMVTKTLPRAVIIALESWTLLFSSISVVRWAFCTEFSLYRPSCLPNYIYSLTIVYYGHLLFVVNATNANKRTTTSGWSSHDFCAVFVVTPPFFCSWL